MSRRRGARGVIRREHHQRGVSLIELLVGLTLGLLVIGVALGAVQLAAGLAGTTSEAARLQQQAAHALRLIGHQARQAGALQLNLAYNRPTAADSLIEGLDPADPVAFDISFDRARGALNATEAVPLQTGQAYYKEHLTGSEAPASLLRDCLGEEPRSATVVRSAFYLKKTAPTDVTGELMCRGSNTGTGAHSIGSGVADFQVRWLRQRIVLGEPVIDRVDAETAAQDWPKVYAVQVCVEMAGTERVDTASATYRPCGWTPGNAETDRGNRLRLVFQNTFQLRTQGAP